MNDMTACRSEMNAWLAKYRVHACMSPAVSPQARHSEDHRCRSISHAESFFAKGRAIRVTLKKSVSRTVSTGNSSPKSWESRMSPPTSNVPSSAARCARRSRNSFRTRVSPFAVTGDHAAGHRRHEHRLT